MTMRLRPYVSDSRLWQVSPGLEQSARSQSFAFVDGRWEEEVINTSLW